LTSLVGLEKSSDVLTAEAQEMIAQFGWSQLSVDNAHGFEVDRAWGRYNLLTLKRTERWKNVSTLKPSPIHFWYRESPLYLVSRKAFDDVTKVNPPAIVSGMITVGLDSHGRLIDFHAVPPEVDSSDESAQDTEWSIIFAAAGLSLDAMVPVKPIWNPTVACDKRFAWEGVYPTQDDIPVRVEAGSYRGKPVFFRVILPWTEATRVVNDETTIATVSSITQFVLMLIVAIVLVGGIYLARRNLRAVRAS